MEVESIISLYNKNDRESSEFSSFIIKKIFSPITHIKQNDPVDVKTKNELLSFVDTMHDNRFDQTFRLLNGLSSDEFDKYSAILKNSFEITNFINNKEINIPSSSLIRHLYQFRLINQNFPNAKNILEVGPGSGYLTCLLSLNDCSVITFEVTKALFIWQHILLKKLNYISDIDNISFDKKSETFTADFDPNKVIQFPWWNIPKVSSFNNLDLIVANHVLCEMHPASRKHLLKIANQSGGVPIFLEGHGLSNYVPFDDVIFEFAEENYFLSWQKCSPKKQIYCFEKSTKTKINYLVNRYFLTKIPFLKLAHKEMKGVYFHIDNFIRFLITRSKPNKKLGDISLDEMKNLYSKYDCSIEDANRSSRSLKTLGL